MKGNLLKLTRLFGPSGFEDAVRKEICLLAEPYAHEIMEDGLGNLIVVRKGKHDCGKRIVLAGYMDECGIMLKDCDDNGFLKFGVVGDLPVGTILGKRVLLGPEEWNGVIGMKPFHLTEAEERKSLPKEHDLYIDGGFRDRTEAEKKLLPGEYGVFYGPDQTMGHSLFGKAMGRSVSCSVLLALMQEELPVDVTFVFAVQHQVGQRGAKAAAHRLKADEVIVLDLCPGADDDKNEPLCGGGAVIPAMDRGAVYDKTMAARLLHGAKVAGISCQKAGKVDIPGHGGAYCSAGMGAKTAAVCCPAKYMNSPCQMVRFEDVTAVKGVLMHYLEEMGR